MANELERAGRKWSGVETEMKQDYREQLVDYVCQFVRIPSRSSALGGDEGELQQVIASHMRGLSSRVCSFEPSDVPGFLKHPLCHGPDRDYTNRPTVIAEMGPENASSLLIIAHSDTVQIFEPDLWTVDPFCGQLRDGAIYGLGAADDKWGLAVMLVVMQAIRDSGQPLRKKLIFASTIDEENGVGNGLLLLHLAEIKAEAALYLDTRGMSINIGCLGGSNLYLRPTEPCSKEDLARDMDQLAAACNGLSKQRARLFDRPFYDHNLCRDSSVELFERSDAAGPFFLIPFYTLPGEDDQLFCKHLDTTVDDALGSRSAFYRKSYRQPWFEPALIPTETPIIRHLARSYAAELGAEPCITTVSKQDSFVLSNHAGIPTISFGGTRSVAGRGSPHAPDERFDVTDLWDAFRVAKAAIFSWLQS